MKPFYLHFNRGMASALVFATIAFASGDMFGQGIPNPNYNPQTPTYLELEDCDGNNSNNYNLGSCAEEMGYLLPNNNTIIQGANQSAVFGNSIDMDFYQFDLEEPALLRINFSSNIYFTSEIFLVELNGLPDTCGSSLEFINFVGTLYMPSNYWSIPNYIIPSIYGVYPAGNYFLVLIANGSSGSTCGDLVYQISIEHLGTFDTGEHCMTATPIEPKPAFNDGRYFDDMQDGIVNGDFGCAAVDIDQAERWYSFTAITDVTYLNARRTGTGNFDGVIEVYDSCEGEAIHCANTSSGNNEVTWFPTTIGETYYFRIYHSGTSPLNNTAFSAAAAHIPFTQLSAADCGRMDLESTDIIRSDWPANQFMLTEWQFQFRQAQAPFTSYVITSPNGSNPQFRMSWFPQAEPGRTYSVRTRARMYQGNTWGNWGQPCTIGMAGTSGLMAQASGGIFAGDMDINVWPNPAQDQFTVEITPAAGDTEVEISAFDLSGKRLKHQVVGIDGSAGLLNITQDTQGLSTGIYLLQVTTASGSAMHKLSVTK